MFKWNRKNGVEFVDVSEGESIPGHSVLTISFSKTKISTLVSENKETPTEVCMV